MGFSQELRGKRGPIETRGLGKAARDRSTTSKPLASLAVKEAWLAIWAVLRIVRHCGLNERGRISGGRVTKLIANR